MKNILNTIILFFIFTASFESYAQQDKLGAIERKIQSIADTFSMKYPGYTISLAFGEAANFTVRQDIMYFKISLPGIDDLKANAKLSQAVDKVSSTDNYYSKILGHQINLFLINALILKEDSLISQGKEQTAIKTLIQQIVLSDIKYCARFTDTYIFDKLEKQHYTNGIIQEMKGLLFHPFKTREEARIIISTRKPEYSIHDTIGYKNKVKQYHSLLQEYKGYENRLKEYTAKAKAANVSIEEWLNAHDTTGFKETFRACLKQKSELETYTGKISNWMHNAEKSKMPLMHWLDSMQASQDTLFVRRYVQEILNLVPLLHAIGQNYLNELAPDIEQLIATVKLSEEDKKEASLQLARMQYKGYEKNIIEDIGNTIKQTDATDYSTLYKLFEKLVYINTQESYYATSPLLLNQNDFNDLITTAPINARFFVQLKQYIRNFPWNEKLEIKELEKKGIYIYSFNDPWDVNNYLPKDFLKQIYQWMITNRGKYEIAQEK